jgi:hypothetical protein
MDRSLCTEIRVRGAMVSVTASAVDNDDQNKQRDEWLGISNGTINLRPHRIFCSCASQEDRSRHSQKQRAAKSAAAA